MELIDNFNKDTKVKLDAMFKWRNSDEYKEAVIHLKDDIKTLNDERYWLNKDYKFVKKEWKKKRKKLNKMIAGKCNLLNDIDYKYKIK